PIGLAPPKNFFANTWLMTATVGIVGVSIGSIPRPATTRVPTELKYSAFAFTQDAPSFRFGWPWTCTPVLQLLSSMGVYMLRPTFTIPGRVWKRCSIVL